MISETGFLLLITGIWASAFLFGSLVIYWFVRQGFSDETVKSGREFPLEERAYTIRSLLIWAGFFAVLALVIVFGG